MCLGNAGVGKSAVTVQFVSGIFIEVYDPTIEDSYRKYVEVDGGMEMLEILDTAAYDEMFTTVRELQIKNNNAFVFVYSIVDQASFVSIKAMIDHVKSTKAAEDGGNKKVPMIIIGNKIDLDSDDCGNPRVVSTEDGRKLAESVDAGFFETSAKTKLNIENLFLDVVRRTRAVAAEEGLNILMYSL